MNDVVPTQNTAQTEMMVARHAQEVQVAMLAAKKFPRDELYAIERVKKAAQRKTLADQAIYSYPRGGKNVTGPSIRLAEAVAQNWGNIDYGVIELENANGKSEMMAYAWDLETNTRSVRMFSVEHKRDTKQGRKDLTDGRDIYELTANMGARRVRACIMAVVPGDVIEMATQECRKTLADQDGRDVAEILKEMLAAFKKLGVSKEQIETYMDKKAADLLKEDLIDLRGVYKAINDGQSKVKDYFPIAGEKATDDQKSAIVAANKKQKQEASDDDSGDADVSDKANKKR